ncbi:MAG: TetR/AcrR family transcriptional regulator [Mycolicibacterium fortuitum]|uniref:TetR family transcriptional regulator n=1 Tax=Mycolicibacterium fortuitum TaxID=1766 RepID=A0ABD6QNZ7_MYCFO|nr:TetR/AcrR family transcriptional regulator [Mycolicibacterium fortuitum]OBB08153.1 TetR family transcriptional regulator [Mycolicibacterium fortuitum]OMC47395.1 TetR family transcriptional regulator [Mycolicibacterium fortuitum]
MAAQNGRAVPAAVAEKLYAATDVIAARGLQNTKIEDIATASGVPKATLYYYFKGKDDILAFLLRDSLDALARDVAAAADGPGSGRDRLAAVVGVQVAHTMKSPDTSQALVGDLGRAIRLPELTSSVQEAFYEPITRVLRAGAVDGSLRHLADPEGSAISIFGAIMLTAMLHNVIRSTKTPDDVAGEVMDFILNGLAPPG